MRIGLVIEQFDPRHGGAEQWTWQFARQLSAARHDVHVLASGFALSADGPEITPHPLPATHSRLAFAASAEAALRRLSFDVVHDMGCGWFCDVFQPHGGSRRAAHDRNLQLLPRWARPLKRMTAPLLARYREFDRLLARQYVADGRVFLALSHMVAEDLRRRHGVAESQLRIVYNGVDTNRFSPAHAETYRTAIRAAYHVQEHELLVLIVAHNFALKGVPALIRAAGQLRRDRVPVHVLVAGGSGRAAYRHLANSCRAKVTFAGSLPDPVPLYAAADLYAQPTHYDPCSLVVLEALASGLPIITTRFNGAGELLTPGVHGFVLADPADSEALASAIDTLRDAATRQRMGRANRALALQHSIEQNCLEILDVYDEIRARPSRRAA